MERLTGCIAHPVSIHDRLYTPREYLITRAENSVYYQKSKGVEEIFKLLWAGHILYACTTICPKQIFGPGQTIHSHPASFQTH